MWTIYILEQTDPLLLTLQTYRMSQKNFSLGSKSFKQRSVRFIFGRFISFTLLTFFYGKHKVSDNVWSNLFIYIGHYENSGVAPKTLEHTCPLYKQAPQHLKNSIHTYVTASQLQALQTVGAWNWHHVLAIVLPRRFCPTYDAKASSDPILRNTSFRSISNSVPIPNRDVLRDSFSWDTNPGRILHLR